MVIHGDTVRYGDNTMGLDDAIISKCIKSSELDDGTPIPTMYGNYWASCSTENSSNLKSSYFGKLWQHVEILEDFITGSTICHQRKLTLQISEVEAANRFEGHAGFSK